MDKNQLSKFFDVARNLASNDKETPFHILYEDNKVIFSNDWGVISLDDIELGELPYAGYDASLIANLVKLIETNDGGELKLKPIKNKPHYYKSNKVKLLIKPTVAQPFTYPELVLVTETQLPVQFFREAIDCTSHFIVASNPISEFSVVEGVLYATDRERFISYLLVEDNALSFSLPPHLVKILKEFLTLVKTEESLSLCLYPSFIILKAGDFSLTLRLLSKDLQKSVLPKVITMGLEGANVIHLDFDDLKESCTTLNTLFKHCNIEINCGQGVTTYQTENNDCSVTVDNEGEYHDFNLKLAHHAIDSLLAVIWHTPRVHQKEHLVTVIDPHSSVKVLLAGMVG